MSVGTATILQIIGAQPLFEQETRMLSQTINRAMQQSESAINRNAVSEGLVPNRAIVISKTIKMQ